MATFVCFSFFTEVRSLDEPFFVSRPGEATPWTYGSALTARRKLWARTPDATTAMANTCGLHGRLRVGGNVGVTRQLGRSLAKTQAREVGSRRLTTVTIEWGMTKWFRYLAQLWRRRARGNPILTLVGSLDQLTTHICRELRGRLDLQGQSTLCSLRCLIDLESEIWICLARKGPSVLRKSLLRPLVRVLPCLT